MAISVEIQDSQLNAAVATALGDLMLALGGVDRPGAQPARQQAVAAAAPKAAPARARAKPRAKRLEWPEFHDSLSADTQRFIALIVDKRQLTMSAAQEALGKSGKGIGGLTGALSRKAGNAGVELPFSPGRSRNGKRAWQLRPTVAKAHGLT